ncbi:MAG: FHA domain-containing protein [Myxococcales bacterium]
MGLLRHQGSGVFCTLDAEHVIGRSPRAALQLDRTYVSAQHASLRWRGDGWDIKDLGSRNGTFVGAAAVGAGQSQRLDRGAQIAFGRGEETWILVDDSPPQASLICVHDDADPVVVEGQILALPSAEDPLVTILANADGGWTIERLDTSSALVTGQEFEVGERRWRFFCPSASSSSSTTEWPDNRGLAGARLSFRVSLDEEHVELSVLRGRETIDLGSREHNYLLLHLARKREAESVTGIPSGACGWLYQDELLDALNVTADRLNVDVYRIRKQFVAALGKEGANVVERRPKTKQLRIGLPLTTVERI